MGTLNTALITAGVLMTVESLFILLFRRTTQRWAAKMSKNKKALRNLGLLELLVSLVIIVLALIVK